MLCVIGKPEDELSSLFHGMKPDAVYFDFSPLRGAKGLLKKLTDKVSNGPLQSKTSLCVVDTHNMIPVWVTSDKRENAARTIRSKIQKHFEDYLSEPGDVEKHPHAWTAKAKTLSDQKTEIDKAIENIDESGIEIDFESGEDAAHKHLKTFVDNGLDDYAGDRNDPTQDGLSNMSPYLHYGQISSLRVALTMHHVANGSGADLHLLTSSKMPKADNAKTKKMAGVNALLEEMIVRKELSDNYCYYEDEYDSVGGADDWAKTTIEDHDDDEREHTYSLEELRDAKTHDEAWNASQRQLTRTGKMHGYMRMYWAKKVKEWTNNAHTAVRFLIELNDTYHIDGGDPNGYVGIMWSVCGVHDRPWTEREVFGKVRYMNYDGLKRKFDVEQYEKQWPEKTKSA